MGFHTKIVVEEVVLPERGMIYKEYVGEYKDISSAFKDFEQDLIDLQIEDYFYFGIFYDNPPLLEDPKKSRAVIGIMVDTKYRNQAITYTIRNPVFTYKEHNELTAISVTFPYRNILSLAWIVYRVYPALVQYGEKYKMFSDGNIACSLELYYKDAIQVAFPYGRYVKDLLFISVPSPRPGIPEPI